MLVGHQQHGCCLFAIVTGAYDYNWLDYDEFFLKVEDYIYRFIFQGQSHDIDAQ